MGRGELLEHYTMPDIRRVETTIFLIVIIFIRDAKGEIDEKHSQNSELKCHFPISVI